MNESSTISINNLPSDVKEDAVHQLFSVFGDIGRIQMPQPQKNPRLSLCLIHFASPESVMRALEAGPLTLSGVVLNIERRQQRVRTAVSRVPSSSSRRSPQNGVNLPPAPVVGSHPADSTEDKDGAGFEQVSSRNRHRVRARGSMQKPLSDESQPNNSLSSKQRKPRRAPQAAANGQRSES